MRWFAGMAILAAALCVARFAMAGTTEETERHWQTAVRYAKLGMARLAVVEARVVIRLDPANQPAKDLIASGGKPPAVDPTPPPEAPERMRAGSNLAVVDLQAQGVSPTDVAVISDMLRSAIIKAGKYKVVEKANMERILAEQSFQQTGCTESECAVKLGKLLNVQLMVVGSVGRVLGEVYMNVRVIDVETGQSTYGDTGRASDSSAMQKAVNKFAQEIAARAK